MELAWVHDGVFDENTLLKFMRRLVSIFWKCIHMYNCIFWHKIAGNLGRFSKRTAGCWVDYDMGSRPRRAELLWCRKGDIFCKISWIWIEKFPRCVWSWRCNKLFWFKGTQKSWMHDGSAITEKFQAIWASASGARNWLLGGNYWVQDLEGQEDGKGLQFHRDKLNFEFFVYLAKGQEEGYGHMGGYFGININLTKLINLWQNFESWLLSCRFPRVCIGMLWQKSFGFKCSTRNSANGTGSMPAEAMGWQVENCNRSAKYWILHKNCRGLWRS